MGDRLDGIEGAGWSAVGRVEWILGAALDAVGNPSPHPSLVPRSFLELAGFRLGEPARKGAAAEAVLRALGFSQKDTADACGYLGHRKLADDPELAAVEIAKRGRDAVAKRERRRRTKRR